MNNLLIAYPWFPFLSSFGRLFEPVTVGGDETPDIYVNSLKFILLIKESMLSKLEPSLIHKNVCYKIPLYFEHNECGNTWSFIQ